MGVVEGGRLKARTRRARRCRPCCGGPGCRPDARRGCPGRSHPSCTCVISLITQLQRRFGCDRCLASLAAGCKVTPARMLRLICTAVFLLFSTTVALIVTDLGVVLSIVGATGAPAPG